MRRSFKLIEIVQGQAARLYALQDMAEKQHMLAEFFSREGDADCGSQEHSVCAPFYPRCESACYRTQYLTDLYTYTYEVGPRRGFTDLGDRRSLAGVGVYAYPFGALKAGPFRIYGMLLGDANKPLFVAGSGGLKLTATIQEDAHLNEQFELVKAVLPAIRRAYSTIGAGIEESLNGALRFPPDILGMELKIK